MCLYGHEIDDTTTVWEANLAWICKLDKGDFIGRDALVAQRQSGVQRILAGFEMQSRLIARDDYPVMLAGRDAEVAGRVTSGSPAPFLKKNIGMAYVPANSNGPGTKIEISIRTNRAPAIIVPTPFYKRAKQRPAGEVAPVIQERNDVSQRISLHQRTRVGSRARRYGHRRHHLLCAA
jgi:aminomethyltransferase